MIPKVDATAGCRPAYSLLPSQAAAEELKTMLHFLDFKDLSVSMNQLFGRNRGSEAKETLANSSDPNLLRCDFLGSISSRDHTAAALTLTR